MYARSAAPLWEHVAGSEVPFTVASPDGKSWVEAKYIEDKLGESHVDLSVRGAIGQLKFSLGPGVGSELVWASDSQKFFVTTSDEGANGSYRLVVVQKRLGTLAVKDITKLIYETFGHPVACDVPEAPNVGGIGWIKHSRNILVAAEIVYHSVCDSAGTFKAYEVDLVSMRVVKTYGQLEAKRRFARLLGDELRGASDECIRKPRSCYVSTNHHRK